MVQKYFNFNNEADLTPVDVDTETGRVSLDIGDRHSEFDSLQEFAEFYAVARNVKPENLKNWVLTEDGDQFAFVLRAGTAGLTADEISEMVRGLRAAGMSPTEIGEAITAAQTQATTHTAEVTRNNLHTRLAVDELTRLDDGSINILFLVYNVRTFEELTQAVAADDDLFQYEDEDDDKGFEYSEDEALDINLGNRIAEEVNVLADEYPDVPAGIAAAIALGIVPEDADDVRETFDKAAFAAHVAHRELAVVLVIKGDGNEAPVVEHAFLNARTKDRIRQYDAVYYTENNRFVIVLSVNDDNE